MPLNNLQKQFLIKYMGNRYAAGENPRRDIIAQAMSKYDIPASDIAQVRYQYTLAKDTIDAAAIVRRTHNRTPLPSEIPSVAGERNRVGQYRTEILVTYTDPNTGRKSSAREYVYSADPMSLDRVRANVNANRDAYINAIRTSDPKVDLTYSGELRTIVLSVGRVYVGDE